MSVGPAGVADLFYLLESNKLGEVEEIKKVFHDHFLCTKDNWLVNGLFDYYLSTNSLRTAEVLAGVRDPHDKHLLDRLSDILSKPGNSRQRIQALTLLGHIARRQPTWLYKLASHALFRDLLKLLKVEADILPLMSALLLLVMLLPMLPAALGPYLPEIFEVFGRLASYYHHHQSSLLSPSFTSTTAPNIIDKDHLYLIHLQVGLYGLFQRLYAMYPCNFISYLKQQYVQRDQLATFTHTIRPMLDSVRMHPSLVTASKDAEISATRWKKMEHHDIVIECGRFTLDKCREEILGVVNSRCTPPLDQSSITCAPINICGGVTTTEISNGEDDTFWSPSMTVPPHSPAQTASLEPRSAPPTPNNNRSGTSPPEAAIEATPETTPVKDLRKLSTRQTPLGSSAVRALNALGNGTSSRPSTPTPVNPSSVSGVKSADVAANTHGFLSNRLSKIMTDRQNVLQSQKSLSNSEENGRLLEMAVSQNGKNDSWQEDQEVLEIVSSHGNGAVEMSKYVEAQSEGRNERSTYGTLSDLSQKIYQLRLYSQCHFPIEDSNSNETHKVKYRRAYNILHYQQEQKKKSTFICSIQIRHSRSCPDMKIQKKCYSEDVTDQALMGAKRREETASQTCDLYPYEHLLLGMLDQNSQNCSQESSDSRMSPISMLDQYIEACTKTNSFSSKTRPNGTRQKQKKKGEEDAEEDGGEDDGVDPTCANNQSLQLMQMQLQFERQRREVHAERNRRLLGKLRDSRASQEHNLALTERLKMIEREVEELRAQLEHNKKEANQAEEQYKEAMHHWQTKCVEEQRQSHAFKDRLEILELELKNEQKKTVEAQQQLRSVEAELFNAGHQLKTALKAADRGKELECIVDTMQKKFVLLGEAQLRLEENTSTFSPTTKQETAQIQKSCTEELNNIRRQLESRSSHLEAVKARLGELENKDARKETQLLNLQRLLQETKEQHASELEAVESKYQAQVEINLHLEGRILELHGKLETATYSNTSPMGNPASSASPKERSPPLSTSLASSSEGSLAFIHPGAGIIMNDCCDTATGEIPNLQAMIEPIPSSSQTTSPSRFVTQRSSTPKQD
ncbi:tuberous sclerosis 1 protein hamartin isoform X1 [Temnothorax americanus]|uniref:tuberous sclerosis 1 protein hamartin isoform X1 n=1 Tax=Temnothorax americanus TaxID=1964332 RepID=UPI004067FDF1